MARKILNGLDLAGQRIQNIGDGTAPGDAVTKAQLDLMVRGFKIKPNVRVATTAAITLSGTQTIDGIALSANDRVLVKNQAAPADNGVYLVAAGSWTRASDFDDTVEVSSGAVMTVEMGTVNGNKLFSLTTDGTITVGTTGLVFEAVGTGSSYTAGAGLSLTGSQFAILLDTGSGLIVSGAGLKLDPSQFATLGLARKYAAAVASGATSATVTHNLGTVDVDVTVIEVATGATVEPDVAVTSANVVTLTFAVAPTSGQYRVVVTG